MRENMANTLFNGLKYKNVIKKKKMK
jgi:hypothetical protein